MTMKMILLAIVFMACAPQMVAGAGPENQLTQAPACAGVDKATCDEENSVQNNEEASLLQVNIGAHSQEDETSGKMIPLPETHKLDLQELGDAEASDGLTQAPLCLEGSRLQILGLINSGTNFFQELLHRNFPYQDYGSPKSFQSQGCDLWKHGSLSFMKAHMPETLRSCSDSHVKAVAVLRNPLSWMSSFKRHPYFLLQCAEGDDWLTRPCSIPSVSSGILSPKGTAFEGLLGKMVGTTYSSVADVWNTYARDYEKVGEFGFEKAVLIRYEDLAMNAEDTFAKVTKMLGINMPSVFNNVQEGVNPNNNETDAQTLAKEKITAKGYLKDFTKQQLQDACIRLDQDLLMRHGYNDCQQVMS